MDFLGNIWTLVVSKQKRKCMHTFSKAIFNAVKKERYDLAIDQLKEVLNSDACNDRQRCLALTLLGKIHVWKSEYEKARDYLEGALDLSLKTKRRSSELYEFLGYAYFKTGDWTGALKFLRLACEYAERGFLNRFYTKHLGRAEERKNLLEEDEDILPFLGAYYKQNRYKFKSPSEQGNRAKDTLNID